jgi:hypothetical protein
MKSGGATRRSDLALASAYGVITRFETEGAWSLTLALTICRPLAVNGVQPRSKAVGAPNITQMTASASAPMKNLITTPEHQE